MYARFSEIHFTGFVIQIVDLTDQQSGIVFKKTCYIFYAFECANKKPRRYIAHLSMGDHVCRADTCLFSAYGYKN